MVGLVKLVVDSTAEEMAVAAPRPVRYGMLLCGIGCGVLGGFLWLDALNSPLSWRFIFNMVIGWFNLLNAERCRKIFEDSRPVAAPKGTP